MLIYKKIEYRDLYKYDGYDGDFPFTQVSYIVVRIIDTSSESWGQYESRKVVHILC